MHHGPAVLSHTCASLRASEEEVDDGGAVKGEHWLGTPSPRPSSRASLVLTTGRLVFADFCCAFVLTI